MNFILTFILSRKGFKVEGEQKYHLWESMGSGYNQVNKEGEINLGDKVLRGKKGMRGEI